MGGLRVISGSAKGLRLKAVPGSGVRPIGDRVKESLFNILAGEIEGAFFLDLFAGTGSVGIEALSRGAERVTFIEKNRQAVQTIKDNLAHTGLSSRAHVIHADSFRILRNNPEEPFDFVFVAPPQYLGLWTRALVVLDGAVQWLNPDARVVAQIHPQELEALMLENLVLVDQRKYGSTLLLFFEYSGV